MARFINSFSRTKSLSKYKKSHSINDSIIYYFYIGPYPTVSPRQHRSGGLFSLLFRYSFLFNDYCSKDFSQHGRYSYDKRTGAVHRSSIHNKTFDQEQLFDNNQYQTTMINSINDNSNEFFRKNMLEDPWTNMKPQKVPPNGISLVDDSTNH